MTKNIVTETPEYLIFRIAKFFYPDLYDYKVTNIEILGLCPSKGDTEIHERLIGIKHPDGWKLTKELKDRLK